MRKSLIAAVAAIMAVGGAAAALAQAPGGTMTVSVSPSKAGTKTKPKAVKLKTTITNSDSKKTAKQIDIFIAKKLKISTKGFKFCKESDLANNGKSACPSRSKVGSGASNALAGVNTATPTPLTFKVTAFLVGKKKIDFYLESAGGVALIAPGTLSKATGKFGTKLSVKVPEGAQQLPPGTFNGLVSLNTTLGAKKLITSTGCSSKKHAFKTVISFAPNPVPPSPSSVTVTSSARCS